MTIVFKHSKLFGDPQALEKLIKEFEKQHPKIHVKDETLPSSSDEQHQFYVLNLAAGSSDFDVFAIDVIWVAEFAAAGWLRDLEKLLPVGKRGEFFRGPIEAVSVSGKVYAVPWFIDAGLLYYRKDLLAQYGLPPPKTWKELMHAASGIREEQRGLYGFIWQGKQYEGLVCNVLEYLWSNGGEILRGSDVMVNTRENQAALRFVRNLVRSGVTPEHVTTATEEPSREIFGQGKAVFHRNWPYAWRLFQQEGSPVKDKVGVSALPHFDGHESAATLGGWQLAVNARSRYPRAAERFVEFMTSAEAQKALALTVGFQPTRRVLYEDKELIAAQPFLKELYTIFETARPRPVTRHYVRISQAMQSEFSAALAGIKKPEEALQALHAEVDRIVGQ